ncbi:hypothetical protein GPX89_23095 [Nocardia sp. ET3-3]|uniref:DUF732 domain-containing protein n=1 Tax=Nocardia terrae TaxID=2675851 RepID=A0A7K1V0F2_9NOCA|nr:hypothetical protein [Nocardia terrae]
MRLSFVAAALVALPLLAACGGGGGSDKPAEITQADVSKSLQTGGLDAKTADCSAKIFVEQGISQDGLRRMLKSDTKSGVVPDAQSAGLSKDDTDKMQAAAMKIISSCMQANH